MPSAGRPHYYVRYSSCLPALMPDCLPLTVYHGTPDPTHCLREHFPTLRPSSCCSGCLSACCCHGNCQAFSLHVVRLPYVACICHASLELRLLFASVHTTALHGPSCEQVQEAAVTPARHDRCMQHTAVKAMWQVLDEPSKPGHRPVSLQCFETQQSPSVLMAFGDEGMSAGACSECPRVRDVPCQALS